MSTYTQVNTGYYKAISEVHKEFKVQQVHKVSKVSKVHKVHKALRVTLGQVSKL